VEACSRLQLSVVRDKLPSAPILDLRSISRQHAANRGLCRPSPRISNKLTNQQVATPKGSPLQSQQVRGTLDW